MTLQELARVLLRRWYAVLAVLICTAAVGILLPTTPGIYWGRATVLFTPPINPERIGNVLEGSDPSLIYFAAAVEKTIEAGVPQVSLSSNAAALYGTGIRRGHDLTLINTGGQWQSNYNRPMIVVEVVAPTADAAQSDLDSLIAAVEQTAATMQRDAGAKPQKMIATEASPRNPQVGFVPGNRTRGIAALGALGIALSAAAAVAADRLLTRRSPDRSSRRSPEPTLVPSA